MITLELGNVGSEAQAKRIEEKISGKTYFNFNVSYSPDAGNWPVIVYTDYEGATEESAKEMLLFVLACEI